VKLNVKEHLKWLAEHLQEYIPESDDSYNLVLSPFDIDFPVPLLASKEQNFLRTFWGMVIRELNYQIYFCLLSRQCQPNEYVWRDQATFQIPLLTVCMCEYGFFTSGFKLHKKSCQKLWVIPKRVRLSSAELMTDSLCLGIQLLSSRFVLLMICKFISCK
jgi:hypothetical protein